MIWNGLKTRIPKQRQYCSSGIDGKFQTLLSYRKLSFTVVCDGFHFKVNLYVQGVQICQNRSLTRNLLWECFQNQLLLQHLNFEQVFSERAELTFVECWDIRQACFPTGIFRWYMVPRKIRKDALLIINLYRGVSCQIFMMERLENT